MSTEDRARIQRHVDDLRTYVEADDRPQNRAKRLEIVANLLLAFPGANGSQESGKARAEAYLMALDDVPPFALQGAVRSWVRGEAGPQFNYRFAPAPAELRQLALDQLKPAKDAIARLRAVLTALSAERAMDPAPIQQAASERNGRVIEIGMRRA